MYQNPLPDAARRALASVTPAAAGAQDGLRLFKVTFHYESGSGRTGIASRTQRAASEKAVAEWFDEAWEDDVLLRFRLSEDSSKSKAPAGSLMMIPVRRVYRIFVTQLEDRT